MKNEKVTSSFKNNKWGVDPADMQLLSKYDEEFWFLSCVIDIFNKYVWVFAWKDKEVITITNTF